MEVVTAAPSQGFQHEYSSIPRSEWPSSSFRAFWLFDDDHPDALYASAIDAVDTAMGRDSSFKYRVDCPSTLCDGASFPPQTITHIGGSIWAGDRTVDDTTTSWKCNLATNEAMTAAGHRGRCAVTSGVDVKSLTASPTSYIGGECFVSARSVVVNITAGMDTVYKVQNYYDYGMDFDELKSVLAETSKAVCSGSTSTSKKGSEPATTDATTTSEEKKSSATAESESGESRSASESAAHTGGGFRVSASNALLLAMLLGSCAASFVS